MTRRTFAVRWVAATSAGTSVLVPLSIYVWATWSWFLIGVGYVAVSSLVLASPLPRSVRAGGAWAGLVLGIVLPAARYEPDLWAELLFAAWFVTFPMAIWLSLAIGAVGALRHVGVLPPPSAGPAVAATHPAYGS